MHSALLCGVCVAHGGQSTPANVSLAGADAVTGTRGGAGSSLSGFVDGAVAGTEGLGARLQPLAKPLAGLVCIPSP